MVGVDHRLSLLGNGKQSHGYADTKQESETHDAVHPRQHCAGPHGVPCGTCIKNRVL